MRTTGRILAFIFAGESRRAALALLCLAALSALSSGCGVGSEALPSTLPPVGGGVFFISTTDIEDGVINRSYSKQLDTTGGTPPVTACTFSGGTPPPGLNLTPIPNTGSCSLSGLPSMAGSFTFTVQAQDSVGNTDVQDYTMAIRDEFTITGPAPDPLPAGVEDVAYNFVFTVMTDTVQGPDDFNESAENGNGPLTACTLTGLPAGLMAVGGTFTANSCQITISGAPNLGIPAGGMPQSFLLTLSVTDSPIAGSNVPAGTLTQTNIDLTIQPPVAIALVTADPMMTACAGGTFDDSTSGGAAPAAVTGRTYGNPQCDLLFMATGGIAPYAWTDNSAMPPTPFGCAQEGGSNEFFRCNSNMMALTTPGGTMTDVTVSVMDSGNAATAVSTQGTDIFGHASHSIFVNDVLTVVSDLGDPLPTAVMGQPYGEAPAIPATFTASGGLGSYNITTLTGGTMNGDLAFPAQIMCGQTNGSLSCATSGGTITAAVGTYMPTVDADDVANDTTANGTDSVTVSIDVVAGMMFTLITANAGTTMACTTGTFADTTGDAPDAVTGRTYGDPGGGGVGPPDCDLLFQVSGGRPPYTWNTNSAAPAPITCNVPGEGIDNAFLRCNSGGAGVAGTTATLGVDVTDSGSSTLGALTLTMDDQGHAGHVINVRDEFASLTLTPAGSGAGAQTGVTGRPYGTPTGSQDLVISIPANTGIGPVTMTPDENTTAGQSAAQGFPNDLDCVQTIDRQIQCTTGAGVITDPAALYTPVVTAQDTGNDTTPAGGFGTNFNLFINDEITINPVMFTNGITGQAYSHTLSCDPMVGFCAGTGNPNPVDAIYTWFEVGGPANADLTVSTLIATNPSTGQYSGTPTTTGTFMPEISVTDDGNDNTPSCQVAMTCPSIIPTFSIFPPFVAVDAINNQVDIYTTTGGTLTFDSNVTLDALSGPFRPAFTPNGSFLVVTDPAESEVAIINVATAATTTVTTTQMTGPLTSGAGDPRGVVIGPASNPLANPDSWVAYVANPTAGTVDVIDVDPNSGAFGQVITSVAIAGAKDVAITPTFAGPETRVYVLSGTDLVCAFDADPGSIGTLIDIDPGMGTCLDTSAIPGDTRFIDITSGFAYITKTTGGSATGDAHLYAIDILPGSPTRDQVVMSVDTGDTASCFQLNDLRANPGATQVWVTCSAEDRVAIFDASTLNLLDTFGTGPNTFPLDIAFNIDGSLAVVTLTNANEILPVDIDLMSGVATPGTAVALTNVIAPNGIDHNRDPQLNALIGAAFPVTVGQAATRQVTAKGGVQPYTFTETSEALGVPGTACHGLSLDSRTGRISGVPMQPGTCTFTVTVSDANGQSRTVEGRIEVKP